jgi:hypothetical protein
MHHSTIKDEAATEQLLKTLLHIAATGRYPQPGLGIEEVWQSAEDIHSLAALLPPKLLKKRKNIHIFKVIDRFQDYATSSSQLSDEEAIRIGDDVLRLFRIISSLNTLLGHDINVAKDHSVRKELNDLFSESATTFETAEFNLFSAAFIQRSAGLPVRFIEEEDERKTPDLRLASLCYVESKDLHTTNRNSIGAAISAKAGEASAQLEAIQLRDPLPGSGLCIDVPWGTLPLQEPEGQLIAQILLEGNSPHFLLFSASGITINADNVGFPVALSLIWRPEGLHLYEPLLRKLTKQSHLLVDGSFEVIDHQNESSLDVRKRLRISSR